MFYNKLNIPTEKVNKIQEINEEIKKELNKDNPDKSKILKYKQLLLCQPFIF
jgi:hypothetical protein